MPHRVEGPPIYRGPDTSAGSFEEDNEELLPIADVVARGAGLSVVRIQALLKEGKVEGEFRPDEGRGHGKWYTSVAVVREYKENLWTPQEWGRKGGLIAGRGRCKSRS